MEQQQREMNLFDLCKLFFQWIGRCFVGLWHLFAQMLRLTFRQWWIVLIVMVASIALGLYYSRPAKRMYKVNAIATLNGVTKDIVRNEFVGLNNASPKVQHQTLTQKLGLPWENAGTLSRFKAFDVIDCLGDSIVDFIDYKDNVTRMDTNYVHMPYMLALQFCTTDPNMVPSAEEAILQYLNSQPYIQRLYEAYRSDLEREVRFHHEQIEKLDSLTSVFYFAQNPSQQVQLSAWTSGMILGSREINLFLEDVYVEMEKTSTTSRRLACCTAPVVLQSHFLVDSRAVNGPIKCTAIAIIIGWLSGLAIAALVENRKRLLAWLKQ